MIRKVPVNIETALADPATVFAFQVGDKTRTVADVRRTKTGRPVVTFSDGFVGRYNGRETVLVAREVSNDYIGKPTVTGPVRHHWHR